MEQQVVPRRRPLVAVPAIVLFVCAFLPTLEVCGDPMMPAQFPPVYVVHLGGIALAVIALVATLRARRGWFTAWFAMWYATAVSWFAMAISGIEHIAGGIVAVVGIVCAFVVLPSVHRNVRTERPVWIAALAHAAICAGWYSLLLADPDALWGAYVGFGASIALGIAAIMAIGRYRAQLEDLRRIEHAPLPVARIVDKS